MIDVKKILLYCFICSILCFTSCSDDNSTTPTEETIFVSKNKIFDYSKTDLSTLIAYYGSELQPKYDVEVYEIKYYTKKKNQAPLVCSGIICLPKTDEKLKGITAWQHGTIYADNELHDYLSYDILEAVISSSLGYISIANDYIGLWASNQEIQAYLVPEFTVSDFLDLLKAANKYIDNKNILTNKDLWLAGYSQGGYNVVAIQRDWEKNNYDFFNLQEVYAGDGPLILSEMAKIVFANDSFDDTALFPPLICGYNFYYDMNLDYNAIYQPEYANIIDSFYGDTSEVQYRLPSQLNKLFTEKFISDIRSETSSIYLKMKANNLNNFSPKNKLYIYHSQNDEVIPYAIGQQAYQYYSSVSGNVELITIPDGKSHRENTLDFLMFALNKLNEN